MKTSGFRCETKFGLLVFLGHPTDHLWITNKEHHLTLKLIIKTSCSIEKWSSSPFRARILVEVRWLWRRSRFQRLLSSQFLRPFLGLVSDHLYLQAYFYLYNCSYLYLQYKLYLTLDNHSWFYKTYSKIFLSVTNHIYHHKVYNCHWTHLHHRRSAWAWRPAAGRWGGRWP